MLSNQKWYLLILSILIGVSGIATAEIDTSLNNQGSLDLNIVQGTTLLPLISPPIHEHIEMLENKKVTVTAYSSTEWETQGDPFITASGMHVKDGIIANNLLPFGTEIKLPGIFGDKVFIVQDRMHFRKSDYHFDIWFPSHKQALNFGAQTSEIEIVKIP
jgi:3D (Asp-Asp-Asp) domain-containing protein